MNILDVEEKIILGISFRHPGMDGVFIIKHIILASTDAAKYEWYNFCLKLFERSLWWLEKDC
jgi:hypothetical protein